MKTLSNLPATTPPLRVLLRLDLNMPLQNNEILDDTRLVRSLPTITELLSQNHKVVILSHFGRPTNLNPRLSLAPIALNLRKYFTCPILFADNCIDSSAKMAINEACPGSIIVLENLRYHIGEESNDTSFTAQLAELGDIYVNDTFSASHRPHASIVGLPQLLPNYAGRALEAELKALNNVLAHPQKPVMAIVGGAKISTKLDLLKNLVSKVDYLVLGGGMANTFLAAQGISVGKSLKEDTLFEAAKDIIDLAQEQSCTLILPTDALVSSSLTDQSTRNIPIDQLAPIDCIFDVGAQTLKHIESVMQKCKTLLWNGPLGVFETPPYDTSSRSLAEMISVLTKQGLISVAGGGDTLSALHASGCQDNLTYTSTAGGAFLEWLEGKDLPGIVALGKN